MNEQYRRGFLQGLLGLAVYAVVSPSRLFSAPTPVPSPDSAPETALQPIIEYGTPIEWASAPGPILQQAPPIMELVADDEIPGTVSQMLAEQVKAVFDTIQDDVIEERQA